MKRYIIISGETSGDIYGGSLMKMIQKNYLHMSVMLLTSMKFQIFSIKLVKKQKKLMP